MKLQSNKLLKYIYYCACFKMITESLAEWVIFCLRIRKYLASLTTLIRFLMIVISFSWTCRDKTLNKATATSFSTVPNCIFNNHRSTWCKVRNWERRSIHPVIPSVNTEKHVLHQEPQIERLLHLRKLYMECRETTWNHKTKMLFFGLLTFL